MTEIAKKHERIFKLHKKLQSVHKEYVEQILSLQNALKELRKEVIVTSQDYAYAVNVGQSINELIKKDYLVRLSSGSIRAIVRTVEITEEEVTFICHVYSYGEATAFTDENIPFRFVLYSLLEPRTQQEQQDILSNSVAIYEHRQDTI